VTEGRTEEWIVFWAVVVLALAVDIAASRKTDFRSAALWSAIWIGLGLAFGGWIALRLGSDAGICARSISWWPMSSGGCVSCASASRSCCSWPRRSSC
jgi:hypothetical protein